MTLILPRRSLLSYPAGTAPGVDLSHVAARGLFLSAVATTGGKVLNLVNGIPLIGTAPTTRAEALGPTTFHTNTTDAALTKSGLNAIPTAATYAAIFRPVTITGASQVIVMYTDGAGDRGFLLNVGIVGSQGAVGSTVASGITLVAGVPYFVAVSEPYNASFNVNFVVRNLATGQVQIAASASNGSPGRTDTTIEIGNNLAANSASESHIAAAMYSPSLYLSMQQLLAWSADPWSFWYPPAPPAQRKVSYSYNYGPAAATTTGGARVLQRFNRSKLAYPAGSLPGIDRSHPASRNCLLAAVATTSLNFVNLLNGVLGTPTLGSGVAKPAIPQFFGPSILFGAQTNFDRVEFAGTTAGANGFTMGALACLQQTSTSAAYILSATANGNNGFGADIGPGTQTDLEVNIGATGYATGLAINPTVGPFGVPYFIAVSVSATGFVTAVLLNLSTGKLLVSPLTSSGGTPAAGDGTFTIGTRGGAARQWPGWIAAVSYSNTVLSTQQLVAWANDPWAFWYPNNTLELVSDGGTPTPPPVTTAIYYLMNVG